MLGMHGMYEANNAMHDCDVMVCIGARFDDRITGRINAFSPGSKKIHIDIDPSSINKNIHVDIPIIGDVANVLEDMLAVWKAMKPTPDKAALKAWWAQIDKWRAVNCLAYKPNRDIIMPQYAIERLYAATRDKDVYITTEVGQHQLWAAQVLPLRGAQSLDDVRRPRHNGLRPAVGGRRPGGAPEVAGRRHRRRCLGADDHAGDVDGGAARPADQDLHPQQPVHGHGAPVAGASVARQPPCRIRTWTRCPIS